jgi:hypothetical protein
MNEARWRPPGYFVPDMSKEDRCGHCAEHVIHHQGRERYCPRQPIEVRK